MSASCASAVRAEVGGGHEVLTDLGSTRSEMGLNRRLEVVGEDSRQNTEVDDLGDDR